MDNNKIKVQADIDLPSADKVNKQIRTLEKKINKLKITGELDDTSLRNLTSRLNNLKATVSTVNFSPTALKELEDMTQNHLVNVNTDNAVNSVNSLGSALNWLSDKLKLLQTIDIGTRLFNKYKDVGGDKMYSPVLF